MIIKPIEFNEITFKPSKNMVDFVDKGDWFGAFIGNTLVGVVNTTNYKIKSLYVTENCRGKGIGGELIKYLCELYHDKRIYTYAIDSSKSLFEKYNFITYKIRECKNFNVYYMEREVDKL